MRNIRDGVTRTKAENSRSALATLSTTLVFCVCDVLKDMETSSRRRCIVPNAVTVPNKFSAKSEFPVENFSDPCSSIRPDHQHKHGAKLSVSASLLYSKILKSNSSEDST